MWICRNLKNKNLSKFNSNNKQKAMLVNSQIKQDVEKMKLKNVNKSLLNCCTHHTNSEDEGFVHLSKSTSVNNTTFFHNYNDVVTGIVLIF